MMTESRLLVLQIHNLLFRQTSLVVSYRDLCGKSEPQVREGAIQVSIRFLSIFQLNLCDHRSLTTTRMCKIQNKICKQDVHVTNIGQQKNLVLVKYAFRVCDQSINQSMLSCYSANSFHLSVMDTSTPSFSLREDHFNCTYLL